jgi:hypothetical protein
MSAMLNSGPTGAERMPSRAHKVLHDPGREPVQNHGHAKKLPTALPQAIVRWTGLVDFGIARSPRDKARPTVPGSTWHGGSRRGSWECSGKAEASLLRFPLLYANATAILASAN